MVTLRERISDFLMPAKTRELRVLADALREVNSLPYRPTPDMLAKMLSEVDSQLVDLLLRQVREKYDYALDTSENVRLSVVRQCRYAYTWDVITQSIVDMWTDYGFETAVGVRCNDENAQPLWDEFWTAKRNVQVFGTRDLHRLSSDVLNDGEFYFVFFISRVDGKVTARTVPTDQIVEFISDPDDVTTVLYFKRLYQPAEGSPQEIYYRNWEVTEQEASRADLPSDAVLADRVRGDAVSGTDVVMMQVAHRERAQRGWPLMTAGIAWSQAYRNFLQDRAAVAKLVATYVDKLKVKGSSRAVDNIAAMISSTLASGSGVLDRNPPPVAGSTFVQNEAVDRERMPLDTGAADAEKDGAPLLAQAGLAGRIYPHYLGRGEAFRLATATAMEVPVEKAFKRYQLFWASVWEDVAEIVLTAAEQYASATFSSFDVDVTTQSIVQTSVEEVTKMIDSVIKSSEAGLIDPAIAQAAILRLVQSGATTLGISGFDEEIENAQTEELAEAAIDQYRASLRQEVYGLWSGKLVYAEFVSGMEDAIDRNLRLAWKDALAEFGLTMSDMTAEEQYTLGAAVLDEYSHIEGFAEYILLHNKASGAQFKALSPRLEMWTNRFRDIGNRARTMIGKDKPLEWVLGPTEHCVTCASLSGKVKRASQWREFAVATGIRPQSQSLACKGFNCLCELAPTVKPLSKGKLPVRK